MRKFGSEKVQPNSVYQRHAIQKLHRYVDLFATPRDFMDGADIRMIQRGRGSRLTAEAFQGLVVLRQFVRQKLQRNETSQRGVLSLKDHAHAPGLSTIL